MRRIPFRRLAVISLAIVAGATAATRPRYGGTLLIETHVRLASFDPSPADPAQVRLVGTVDWLIGDRLARLDNRGIPQPSLAVSWQAANDNRNWTFQLRPGVRFQDGESFTAQAVVRSLASLHPDWRVSAEGGAIRIELDSPMPVLPLELALPENTILRPGANNLVLGTGPFRLTAYSSASMHLAANEEGWQPRPYLDGIEILTGRAPQDQWVDYELRRADIVEIGPAEIRRAMQNGARLWSARPDELVALVFQSGRPAAEDARVRQALSAGVNRAALRDGLLQKQGEIADSLLPEWLTGYAFLFAPETRPTSQPAAGEAIPALTLGFDSSDSLLAGISSRIAVDCRAAGITMRMAPASGGRAPVGEDVRLIHTRFGSLDPGQALRELVNTLGLSAKAATPAGDSPTEVYAAEQSMLDSHWVIPLVYVRQTYALGPAVRDWQAPDVTLAAGWRLEDVWKQQE